MATGTSLYQISESTDEETMIKPCLKRIQSHMEPFSSKLSSGALVSKTSFLSMKSESDHGQKVTPRRQVKSNFNMSSSFNGSSLSGGSKSDSDALGFNRAVRRRMSRHMSMKLPMKPLVVRTLFTKEEVRDKLRYAIRMVLFSVRLHIALKMYSRNMDKDSAQTLDQLNYYSMESEFTTETLVFTKSYFSASNVVYMPAWARALLATSSLDRSQSDITRMASLIRRLFTKTLREDSLLQLCKHCAYTRYEKKRVLIRSGHRPLYCYVIFSGSVFVNIEHEDKSTGKKYSRTQVVLKKGAVFGETGVIHNLPRNATIVSRENVECLLVPPDVCKRVFPQEIESEYKYRLANMRQSDLFAGWPDEAIQQMCGDARVTEYSYDEIIDKNARDSEFIYMVVKARELVQLFNHDSAGLTIVLGRVELMTYVDLSHDGCRQPVSEHSFLPPIPVPCPQSSLSNSRDSSVQVGDRMVVSIDFLYPHQTCDLLSLLKPNRFTTPLILVSRGAEVICYPKLRLKTTPPLKCWKLILEKAKSSPTYPGNKILSRLCIEHRQWSAYKKLILWDTLDSSCGRFNAMKPETSKTAVRQFSKKKNVDEDKGNTFTEKSLRTCLQNEAPLHDLVKHSHKGMCIQSWSCFSKDGCKPTQKSYRTLN